MNDKDDFDGEYYQVKKKTPERPEAKIYEHKPDNYKKMTDDQIRFLAKITRMRMMGTMSDEEWVKIWDRIKKSKA